MNVVCGQEKMKSLWEEMFDASIEDDENFFDRGDSLTALILLASIEKEMGVRIEFSQLVEAPTIAGVMKLMRQGKSDGEEHVSDDV